MSILLLGGRFLLGLSLSGLCLVLGSFVGLDSLAGGGTIGWGSIRVSSWDITLGQHLESNVLELLSLVNEILCLLGGSSLGSGLLNVLDLCEVAEPDFSDVGRLQLVVVLWVDAEEATEHVFGPLYAVQCLLREHLESAVWDLVVLFRVFARRI